MSNHALIAMAGPADFIVLLACIQEAGGSEVFVALQRISAVVADGNNTRICLDDGSRVSVLAPMAKVLQQIEDHLTGLAKQMQMAAPQ